MLSQFKSMVLCAAVASLTGVSIQSTVVGQQCTSCATATCACSTNGGCRSGNCGLANGQVREDIHKALERNALVAERNNAWPKPFSCVDRQTYENAWGQFIDAGYERQCVLSSMHFDQESGELNQFGRTIVSGLLQNMPQSRKAIYVHRDGNEERSQVRLDNVRESIEYMFGHQSPALVAFSDKTPMRVSALRIETLQALEAEATPVPIIPIAAGNSSVGAALGGN